MSFLGNEAQGANRTLVEAGFGALIKQKRHFNSIENFKEPVSAFISSVIHAS